MSYDPAGFWQNEGKRVMYGLDEPRYADHYHWLINYLGHIQFSSVLEVGAGDGRITDYMLDNFFLKQYTCVDMSKDRKAMFTKNLPSFEPNNYLVGEFQMLDVPAADLVLAVETLVHVRPEAIEGFIGKMISKSKKHVVFIEYEPKEASTLAYYCFAHNYKEILRKIPNIKVSMRRVNNIQKLYHIEKGKSAMGLLDR
jgi:ubiquinone/menaquinone biosynthesis C-methylase UbiE